VPPVGDAPVVVCAGATVGPPAAAAGPGSTTCTVVLSWDASWIWTPPSQCDAHGAAWT
jgi:hypothetical protein